NIHIVSVGKLKEKYLKLGVDEFQKRLQKYCKLKLTEVPDQQAAENLSEKDLIRIKNIEGDKILKHIKPSDYIIALAIDGKQLSSEGLAKEIEQLSIHGKSNIAFIIGGSNGLSDAV